MHNWLQKVNRRAELNQRENHFKFIKMHYHSPLASHVRYFGSVMTDVSDMGELEQKEQIKVGYRR